ncbi:hypothetical protein C8Q78DRAFT_654181 [Trametes maxima]|nr:hypothetical protein C8Q78DRAFT_654181 [Trametes maxima]
MGRAWTIARSHAPTVRSAGYAGAHPRCVQGRKALQVRARHSINLLAHAREANSLSFACVQDLRRTPNTSIRLSSDQYGCAVPKRPLASRLGGRRRMSSELAQGGRRVSRNTSPVAPPSRSPRIESPLHPHRQRTADLGCPCTVRPYAMSRPKSSAQEMPPGSLLIAPLRYAVRPREEAHTCHRKLADPFSRVSCAVCMPFMSALRPALRARKEDWVMILRAAPSCARHPPHLSQQLTDERCRG